MEQRKKKRFLDIKNEFSSRYFLTQQFYGVKIKLIKQGREEDEESNLFTNYYWLFFFPMVKFHFFWKNFSEHEVPLSLN
jgi:hypothetical protein